MIQGIASYSQFIFRSEDEPIRFIHDLIGQLSFNFSPRIKSTPMPSNLVIASSSLSSSSLIPLIAEWSQPVSNVRTNRQRAPSPDGFVSNRASLAKACFVKEEMLRTARCENECEMAPKGRATEQPMPVITARGERRTRDLFAMGDAK